MHVGCGFLFVGCVTTVIGNQRYIRTANLSFCRRKSRTKVITGFLLDQHRTKKRRFQNFKESIFMVKNINKSNLMWFRCKKNKQIKKHRCNSLLFFLPLTNNDCISFFQLTFVNKTELKLQFLMEYSILYLELTIYIYIIYIYIYIMKT